ncbi:MAG TPA: hypothetical protein VFX28_18935, partial [Methylomirabilota bacterium]|nr:hypothetical protein [Methylomirabilota bacterium]
MDHLPLGILAGLAAAAVGAGAWALVSVLTGYQIGFMALGVGILVGYAVRAAGHGKRPVFGVAGAVLALLGCMAGNLLTIAVLGARQAGVETQTVLASLTPAMALELMQAGFSLMDLLFYAIAVYE